MLQYDFRVRNNLEFLSSKLDFPMPYQDCRTQLVSHARLSHTKRESGTLPLAFCSAKSATPSRGWGVEYIHSAKYLFRLGFLQWRISAFFIHSCVVNCTSTAVTASYWPEQTDLPCARVGHSMADTAMAVSLFSVYSSTSIR